MRVALVSSCSRATPPQGRGGAELVLSELAKGLVARGHDVTVYATGDSRVAGRLVSRFRRPVDPRDGFAALRHLRHAWHDIAAGGFDLVNVIDPAALAIAPPDVPATVLTVFDDCDVRGLAGYLADFPDVTVVASSNAVLARAGIEDADVVHPGLDPAAYPPGNGAGGYVAYVGSLSHGDAPHVAIDAARAAGVPLRIAGEADDDDVYFANEIRPRLVAAGRAAIDWVGGVSFGPRIEMLRHARALVLLKPDVTQMIEAMLVGTPVCVMAPEANELVDDGITGWVVEDGETLAACIAGVGAIDRRACRARALERWTTSRMAAEYDAIYAAAVQRRPISGARVRLAQSDRVAADVPLASIHPREPEPLPMHPLLAADDAVSVPPPPSMRPTRTVSGEQPLVRVSSSRRASSNTSR